MFQLALFLNHTNPLVYIASWQATHGGKETDKEPKQRQNLATKRLPTAPTSCRFSYPHIEYPLPDRPPPFYLLCAQASVLLEAFVQSRQSGGGARCLARNKLLPRRSPYTNKYNNTWYLVHVFRLRHDASA